MKAAKNSKIDQFREIQRMGKLLGLTVAPLQSDVDFAIAQWSKDKGNQFWRRTAIRCLLALLEATVWNMKNLTLKISEVSGVGLTVEEVEIAKEERTVIKDGKHEKKPKYLPFRDNVKATFRMFAKVHDVPFTFNADKNFDSLCATYELRSRLMHPKKPFDPDVSDKAIDTAEKGVGWLNKEWGDLMTACSKAASEITRES